jgi:sulfide:quinone oxidoreductase
MARSGRRPTIAILGGGVGGTVLANLLARELGPEEAELVLVDRSGHHVYQPGWLYIPFGDQDAEHLERKERSLLRDRIKLIIGDAHQLDLAKQQVLIAADHSDQITEQLHYDYLVFASGARISPEEVPGLAEALANGNAVHHFYTQRGAERLREALAEFRGGTLR